MRVNVPGTLEITQVLQEDRSKEQYFFTTDTVEKLAKLGIGYTACLCTPSIAKKLTEQDKKDLILLDIDPRLRELFPQKDAFVIYDLQRGLHSDHQRNADELTPQYEYKFDTVIFDPPFSGISPADIAKNTNALLKFDLEGETYAYIVYPISGAAALEKAFLDYGFVGQERKDIRIEYQDPPKAYAEGRKSIGLFQFRRV